jgi:hypothetical protein
MGNLAAVMAGLAMLALVAPAAFAHNDSNAHGPGLPFYTTGLDHFGPDDDSPGQTTPVQTVLPERIPYYVNPCTMAGYSCPVSGNVTGGTYGNIRNGPRLNLHQEADNPGHWGYYREERVAGWYYGSASDWTEYRASTLATLCPTSWEPECPASDGQPVEVNPGFFFSPDVRVWCDMEVAYGESIIDGYPGGDNPDGMFDDGGFGGACHVPGGYYEKPEYGLARWGCGSYEPAAALDAVLGEDIWITTACDTTTPAVDAALQDHLRSTASCNTNAVTSGSDLVSSALDCAETFASCAVTGSGCPYIPEDSSRFCGADGVADVTTEGYGGGADGPGVPFPYDGSDGSGCYYGIGPYYSAASVIVWNAIGLQTTPGVGAPRQSIATYGWIA